MASLVYLYVRLFDRTKAASFSKPHLSHQACVGLIGSQLDPREFPQSLWPAAFGHQRRSRTGCTHGHLGMDARVLRVWQRQAETGFSLATDGSRSISEPGGQATSWWLSKAGLAGLGSCPMFGCHRSVHSGARARASRSWWPCTR
jgi:hypothetical protein